MIKVQEEVAATGHTVVTDEAVASTCTKTGLTEGNHCSVCGEVLTAQEEVAATGHTEVVDEAIAPTCTKTGLTEGSHCSVCGEVIKAQEEVAATGHTVVMDEAVAPTCTKTGLTEGSHCSVCGVVLTAQEEVAATGHIVVTDEAVAPTCTKTGLTEGSHCSVCGEVIKAQTTVAKKAHSYGAWKVTRKATALKTGVKVRTCKTCGTKQTATIKKLKPTIKLNASGTLPIKVKQSARLKVTKMAYGDKVKKWTSSNKKVVTVTSKGVIKGRKKGTARVTVTLASGKKATIKIKVQKTNVKTTKLKLNVAGKVTLEKGKTFVIKPTKYPITSGEKVKYAVSNKKILKVTASGKVKALKKGKAYVVVKAGTKKVRVKVIVK